MTADEFRARLEALGLSQPGFARVVSEAGGEPLPLGTVRGWAQGRRAIPPTVPALLALVRCLLERSSYQGDALGVPAGDGVAPGRLTYSRSKNRRA